MTLILRATAHGNFALTAPELRHPVDPAGPYHFPVSVLLSEGESARPLSCRQAQANGVAVGASLQAHQRRSLAPDEEQK